MKKSLFLFFFVFQLACNTFIQADDNLIFNLDNRNWMPSPWDQAEAVNKDVATYEMLSMPKFNDHDFVMYENLTDEPEETIFVQKLPHTKDELSSLIVDFSEVKKYPSSETVEFKHKILKESKNRLLVEWTSKDSSGRSREGVTYFLRSRSQVFSVHYATTIMDWAENHFTKWAKILKKAHIAKRAKPAGSTTTNTPNRFIFTKEGIHSVS